MNFRNKLQHNFPKMRGGAGGQRPFGTFPKIHPFWKGNVSLRGRIVELVAFVWLFSTMCFQMSPQIACLRGCKVTFVAFVWLFSTVYFQMCRIVTLVAFLSSTCLFHWNLNSCGFTKISLFTILIHFWHESSVLPSCKFRFQLRDGMRYADRTIKRSHWLWIEEQKLKVKNY